MFLAKKVLVLGQENLEIPVVTQTPLLSTHDILFSSPNLHPPLSYSFSVYDKIDHIARKKTTALKIVNGYRKFKSHNRYN